MPLELAHAWTSMEIAPPHWVNFASVTAEEQGLLGIGIFWGSICRFLWGSALDLNYDAIQPFGEPMHASVGRGGANELQPVVEATARP